MSDTCLIHDTCPTCLAHFETCLAHISTHPCAQIYEYLAVGRRHASTRMCLQRSSYRPSCHLLSSRAITITSCCHLLSSRAITITSCCHLLSYSRMSYHLRMPYRPCQLLWLLIIATCFRSFVGHPSTSLSVGTFDKTFDGTCVGTLPTQMILLHRRL